MSNATLTNSFSSIDSPRGVEVDMFFLPECGIGVTSICKRRV